MGITIVGSMGLPGYISLFLGKPEALIPRPLTPALSPIASFRAFHPCFLATEMFGIHG